MRRATAVSSKDGKRRRGTGPQHGRYLPACPATGKKSFASRAKARKALGGRGAAKEAYKCPHCPHWHTTSRRSW